MPPLRLDPDYAQAVLAYTSLAPSLPINAHTIRDINNGVMQTIMLNLPCPEADFVEETTRKYLSTDGTPVTLHVFTPLRLTAPECAITTSDSDSDSSSEVDLPTHRPAILYIHGGGYISGSVGLYRKDIIRYAHQTQTTIFAPAYRLAPEHPYRAALEDVFCALNYINEFAAAFDIDVRRIAVMGVGAGGGLAVGTALLVRDVGVGEPWIEKLVLVCPMLDDRTRVRQGSEVARHLTWTEVSNNIAWGAYLGRNVVGGPVVILKRGVEGLMELDQEEEDGGDAAVDDEADNGAPVHGVKEGEEVKVCAYAAPGRARDLRGLPRTYIDVGGLDLFRDECIDFARKLARADVEFELHVYPGVPHSWEWMSPDVPVTKQAMKNRVQALKDI